MAKTADELAAEGARILADHPTAQVVILTKRQEHLAVEAQCPFIREGRLLTTIEIGRDGILKRPEKLDG